MFTHNLMKTLFLFLLSGVVYCQSQKEYKVVCIYDSLFNNFNIIVVKCCDSLYFNIIAEKYCTVADSDITNYNIYNEGSLIFGNLLLTPVDPPKNELLSINLDYEKIKHYNFDKEIAFLNDETIFFVLKPMKSLEGLFYHSLRLCGRYYLIK